VRIESEEPPVMIYSWIAVCLVTLTVAYSMAEMCSAYPVAGGNPIAPLSHYIISNSSTGQYSWVVVLAPPKIARGMSWVTGWFIVTGDWYPSHTPNFI
jgi:choline transport protein